MKVNKNKKKNKFKGILTKEIILALLSLITMAVVLVSLSTAWFTNVSKTSNIVFKVENWGYDESNIIISDEPLSVFPGASGIINLQLSNEDIDTNLNVDITIDKSSIFSELEEKKGDNSSLRRRIYFYVDKEKTYEFEDSNKNETVERIYVGNDDSEGYRYILESGRTLSMSNDYYSVPPLKWMWVYDLTGYYFKGRIENNEMYVTEYIRPIEYDYDTAVFDENGYLTSVNDIPLRDFLINISSKDGYYGTFTNEINKGTDDNPEYVESNNVVRIGDSIFYKVNVEDNRGIYAYLCTKNEIELANNFDTNITLADEPIKLFPKLNITVSKTLVEYTEVSSKNKLIDVINDENSKIKSIKLTRNITLDEPLRIDDDNSVSIDFNGLSISYLSEDNNYDVFYVEEGSSLNLFNGNIKGNNQENSSISSVSTTPIRVNGGNVSLYNMHTENFDSAIVIDDSDTLKLFDYNKDDEQVKQTNSIVQIVKCDLVSNHQTVYVLGNGVEDELLTKLEIVDSKITSNEYFALCGSGKLYDEAKKINDCFGTEISIRNSVIDGYYAGIYLPQMLSTTSIVNSEVVGNVGICIKGGTLNIADSKIIGTGEINPIEIAQYRGSGFSDTGDAIYVDGSFKFPLYVNIIGYKNLIESQKTNALDVFGYEDSAYVNVVVEGGTFKGKTKALSFNNIGLFKVYSLKKVVGSYSDEGIILCFDDDEINKDE